jgi:hypothetical protein
MNDDDERRCGSCGCVSATTVSTVGPGVARYALRCHWCGRDDPIVGVTLDAPPWPRWHRARWVHRVRAWLGHYFWLPCPLCGRGFGGHEVGSRSKR